MSTIIVYSTKHGSAARCAEILEEKAKNEITVKNVKEVKDTEGFDRVILGASVYVGKIQPEMAAFCERNRASLMKKELGLFICSGDHSEKGREYLKLFGDDLHAHATAKELFGDEIHWETMNFIEKLLMRIIKKASGSYSNLEMGNISSFARKMEL
jgi:menaquinone-dependent protoporphyrinogen oxidase